MTLSVISMVRVLPTLESQELAMIVSARGDPTDTPTPCVSS
jgi:hypothetical protein